MSHSIIGGGVTTKRIQSVSPVREFEEKQIKSARETSRGPFSTNNSKQTLSQHAVSVDAQIDRQQIAIKSNIPFQRTTGRRNEKRKEWNLKLTSI